MIQACSTEVGSAECCAAIQVLLQSFDVDINDPNLIEHYLGYVETADLIAVTPGTDNNDVISGVALMSRDAKPGEYRIDFIAVDSEQRGKGLGSTLIRFCEEHAKQAGANRMLIQSTIGNGHEFYKSLGYLTTSSPEEVATTESINFFKDL